MFIKCKYADYTSEINGHNNNFKSILKVVLAFIDMETPGTSCIVVSRAFRYPELNERKQFLKKFLKTLIVTRGIKIGWFTPLSSHCLFVCFLIQFVVYLCNSSLILEVKACIYQTCKNYTLLLNYTML